MLENEQLVNVYVQHTLNKIVCLLLCTTAVQYSTQQF